MKIFLDVDNTILEHTNFYSEKTEGRIHKIFNTDPTSNEEAIRRMYEGSVCSDVDNLKKLLKRDDFYILTKTSNDTYEKYKRIRMAQLFNISVDELLSMKDKDGKPKYITVNQEATKADYLMECFAIDSIKDFILVDDYSQNIIEWEEEGGIGIKFHNEYNSCSHPNGGLVISNFKIFTYFSNKKDFTNIVIDSTLRDIFNIYYPNANYIDFFEIIKNDIIKRFSIEEGIYENTKNSFTDFLTEYYSFVEKHNFDEIMNIMEKQFSKDKRNIIIHPFAFSDKAKKYFQSLGDTIFIAYSKSSKDKRIRDLFISTPSQTYSNFVSNAIHKSLKTIQYLEK